YRADEIGNVPNIVHREHVTPGGHGRAVHAEEYGVIKLAVAEVELLARVGHVARSRSEKYLLDAGASQGLESRLRVAEQSRRRAFAVARQPVTADAVGGEHLLAVHQRSDGRLHGVADVPPGRGEP